MGRRGPKAVKAEPIARAALALFVEKGVKGATTRAIARRAQTTEASLYRHYDSKEDLARRVLYDCLASFGESIERSLAGVAGPRARLRAFVRAYLEFAAACPLEHSYILQAHVYFPVEIPDEILRPRQILTDILTHGQATGEFSMISPRLLAPLIAGGLGRVTRVLDPASGGDHVESATQALCDAIERLASPREADGSQSGEEFWNGTAT